LESSELDDPVVNIAEAADLSQQNPMLASSIQLRSAYDNIESRKLWEIEKFDAVVTFIREQLSSSRASNCDKILLDYLKYPACYNISFLQAVAVEFEIDISEIVCKRRVSHKEGVDDLVNKLISK
jgi:hypothetical protein